MKKSKLIMISSFALAMVASLVMAFALMNVTNANPATVLAETKVTAKTLYFYQSNDDTFDAFQLHSHDYTAGDLYYGGFEDKTPVTGTTNWYSFDIDDLDNGFEFEFKYGSSYQKSTWYQSNQNVFMLASGNGSGVSVTALTIADPAAFIELYNENSYYIVGTIDGDEKWYPSESSYVMSTTGLVDPSNNTAYTRAHFTNGDSIKVYHHGNYYGTGSGSGSNQDIGVTGYYDVWFRAGWTDDKLKIENNNDYEIKDLRTNVSKDNRYLLMIAAFKLSDVEATAESIGFIINGEYVNGTTYYTGVTYKTGDATTATIYSETLYGSGYVFIVYELELTEGTNSYDIQAAIKDSTGYIARSNRIYGSITTPAA